MKTLILTLSLITAATMSFAQDLKNIPAKMAKSDGKTLKVKR